nr:MAG TPA: hypothetical protein [Caudoviricetes sp.]
MQRGKLKRYIIGKINTCRRGTCRNQRGTSSKE